MRWTKSKAEAQKFAISKGIISTRAKVESWRCSNCGKGYRECDDFDGVGASYSCKPKAKKSHALKGE